MAAWSDAPMPQAKVRQKPRYTCELCGKQGRAEDMFRSKFTGNRFCKSDRACDERRRAKGWL